MKYGRQVEKKSEKLTYSSPSESILLMIALMSASQTKGLVDPAVDCTLPCVTKMPFNYFLVSLPLPRASKAWNS